MTDNNGQIIKSLKKAVAGLLLMSESDYPFEVIRWEASTKITSDFLRSITGETKECPVQELEVEQVLSSGRYRPVLLILQTHLSNVRAYKVGRINMPVYLVGRASDGSWVGLATRVVET